MMANRKNATVSTANHCNKWVRMHNYFPSLPCSHWAQEFFCRSAHSEYCQRLSAYEEHRNETEKMEIRSDQAMSHVLWRRGSVKMDDVIPQNM